MMTREWMEKIIRMYEHTPPNDGTEEREFFLCKEVVRLTDMCAGLDDQIKLYEAASLPSDSPSAGGGVKRWLCQELDTLIGDKDDRTSLILSVGFVRRLRSALQSPRPASGWKPTMTEGPAVVPTEEAADAFWRYWGINGETHKHGYYESTWGAINAALRTSGVVWHDYLKPLPASPQPDAKQQEQSRKGER